MMARTKAAQAISERVAGFEAAVAAARRRMNAEAIHRVRVSLRRLQAALRLCPEDDQRATRRLLRPILKAAGAVRNCDIAAGMAVAAGLGARHELRERIDGERRVRLRKLRKRLSEPIDLSGVHPPAGLVARPTADFARFASRASRLGEKLTTKRLHRLRIAGKHLRYALELWNPADRRLAVLKEVQDLLGELNDCVTMREEFPRSTLDQQWKDKIRRLRNEFRKRWPGWARLLLPASGRK